MAPLFQAREIPRIVPSLPPVKRLAADTEVATGQRRILSMPPVMVQPLQSCFCQPADPLDPAYDFGTRSSHTYYLHDDTILSVTHHYDREHRCVNKREGQNSDPMAWGGPALASRLLLPLWLPTPVPPAPDGRCWPAAPRCLSLCAPTCTVEEGRYYRRLGHGRCYSGNSGCSK